MLSVVRATTRSRRLVHRDARSVLAAGSGSPLTTLPATRRTARASIGARAEPKTSQPPEAGCSHTAPGGSLVGRPDGMVGDAPGWRNRQTRRSQKPLPARAWGFESPSRHHRFEFRSIGVLYGEARGGAASVVV